MKSYLVLLLVLLPHLNAAEFFATPEGTGTGSITAPFNLRSALNASLKPGDTLWLRGGAYTGTFYSTLTGNVSQPVIVRSYAKEWAKIVGGIAQSTGGYVTYQDLEVTGGRTNHTSAQPGSWPTDLTTLDSLNMRAPGIKLVNMILHDAVGNAACLWTEAPDSEIYGCLIYYNGFQGSDRGHGHGIYSQNRDGKKVFADNIVFGNYDHGIQIYGSSSAFLRHFDLEGNVSYLNGSLSRAKTARELVIYGGDPPQDIRVVSNYCYSAELSAGVQFGEFGGRSIDLLFTDNIFQTFTRVANWQRIIGLRNTFTRPASTLEFYQTSGSLSAHTWNSNTYFSLETPYPPFMLYTNASRGLNFPAWKTATGYDRDSAYTKGVPSGLRVFVRPNRYDPGRLNIVVYNWNNQTSVAVPLSSTLPMNTRYEVRDAMNWFAGPLLTGVYSGQALILPMTGLSAAKPDGAPAPPHSAPVFGAFVLLSTSAGTPPLPPPRPPTVVNLDTNGILLQGQNYKLLIMPQP